MSTIFFFSELFARQGLTNNRISKWHVPLPAVVDCCVKSFHSTRLQKPAHSIRLFIISPNDRCMCDSLYRIVLLFYFLSKLLRHSNLFWENLLRFRLLLEIRKGLRHTLRVVAGVVISFSDMNNRESSEGKHSVEKISSCNVSPWIWILTS